MAHVIPFPFERRQTQIRDEQLAVRRTQLLELAAREPEYVRRGSFFGVRLRPPLPGEQMTFTRA